MKNAKNELILALINANMSICDIDFIDIKYHYGFNKESSYRKINDINKLDFVYDNDFGIQELYGNVVFKDGTWLMRYEYDGAEEWRYMKTPSKIYN